MDSQIGRQAHFPEISSMLQNSGSDTWHVVRYASRRSNQGLSSETIAKPAVAIGLLPLVT
jgi:hypothetical protein